MKTFRLLFFLSFYTFNINAQISQYSLGMRGGVTSCFLIQLQYEQPKSFEIIVGNNFHKFSATLLVIKQCQTNFNLLDNIKFYSGYGIHGGIQKNFRGNCPYENNFYSNFFIPVIGLDAIWGAEYLFTQIPVSMGMDFKPFFNLAIPGLISVNLVDIAITVKYQFNKI